jgi:photosystem II stability/assembly factor-like uncharacterized protein
LLFFADIQFSKIQIMRKLVFLCMLLIASVSICFSQLVNLNHFKNMKPRSIGPAGMSGRVTSIDALWSNPDVIYVGTASGGIWKTENAGASWLPVFDEQPILNIGALTIQQSNPSVVWAGTGEGNPRNSLNIGGGIYKSIDGGRNWKMMGLEKTRNIHRIIIDPVNPNTVYAAAIGNPFAEHPERGVYKTTDGGTSWERILYTNDTTGCGDLVMDPSNPNKLLAGMWQHRRTPWSFSSGGRGSGFYMTLDGGKNWKKLGKEEGLPEGNYGRIGIAIARSEPNRIYAMLEATKNGLYRTDDGGFKWELVNSDPQWVTNRPFYFQDIAVDSKNENRLYNINQIISMSEDGGKNFKVIVPYSGIHPDHHAFWIHPENPSIIIDGNDGGIGISRDRGRKWIFNEQLPVGQFYHVNVDNQLPYNIMGGMQDNGSWRGPAYTWIDGGIRNYYWESLWGGDGFDVVPDPENPNTVYAMSQGGYLGSYNITTGQSQSLRPPAADMVTRLRFNWNAGLAIDPLNAGTIYYGSQFLHKSNNKGLTWEIISPDLTTDNKQQQRQDENGGLTIDITGAENYNTILCVAPSYKERGVIWVGTDDGNVQLTRDNGKSWTNFRDKIPGLPTGAWIPQIRASQHNAGEAFVVANDYRRGDFKPYIFRTKDYGKTWERILDEKKVTGYALCVIQDPVEPNLVFAGTEQGLWISFNNGASWQQWKNGYPSVSTYDLAIQEREADLAIATFGRAMYILDDIRPLRKVAAGNGRAIEKTLSVFEAPVAYQASYRNTPGYEWSTNGIYEGQNRNRGAMISFFVKPVDARDTVAAKKKMDSVMVKIYNDKNEAIRSFKIKVDSGLNRFNWQFDTKGIRQPGSPKPKPNAPEQRGGMPAFPGTYKMVMSMGKEADSILLTVNGDPRQNVSKEIYDAQNALLERLNKTTTRLTDATDRLTEAEEVITKLQAQLKDVEGKEADSLRKTAKAMTDSIKSIRNTMFGKAQEKQGYGSPYQLTPMMKLGEARGAAISKRKIPDAQELRLATEAETLADATMQKVNTFFDTHWKEFRRQAEATPLKLFKDYSPLQ